MQKISEGTSALGIHRIWYEDSEGNLVERIVHDHDAYDALFDENQELASEQKFSPNFRKIASIPVDIYEKWLKETGSTGYLDEESIAAIIDFQLSNPDNSKFLTVPRDYRIKKC
jgi:hypothetical protein